MALEIGGVGEATFCHLDCKYRANPHSLTDEEVGMLIERSREENWQEYMSADADMDEFGQERYDEGHQDGYTAAMVQCEDAIMTDFEKSLAWWISNVPSWKLDSKDIQIHVKNLYKAGRLKYKWVEEKLYWKLKE